MLRETEQAVEQYAEMVYRLALSRTRDIHNAEDVFQEVFLRLLRLKKPFESEEHRRAWLIRVTINCSKKWLCSAWIRRTVPLEESLTFPDGQERDVYFSVLELPAQYRTVIHLHYYERLSIEEMASVLSISESAVKSRLFRARNLLRETLKEEF
ncbi:MAG: sigma-70 family RNA polymerase sigma factor [Clostridiales bacterium]|nr:sigma-70 family RNA polymerase sigma factor [Clostridiales bacterium]